MLQIVLLVLKIAGLILLSVLSLFIIVVLLAVFVPIRYRIRAGKREDITGEAVISWMFHFLHIRCTYEKSAYMSVRIFGIPVYDSRKAEEKAKRKQGRKKRREVKKSKTPEKKEDMGSEKPLSRQETLTQDQIKMPETEGQPDQEQRPEEKETEELRLTFLKKLKLLIQKILAFFRSIGEKIRNFQYTIQELYDRISRIAALLQREDTKRVVALCKKNLLRILRMVKPRIFLVRVKAGTGDPASAGQILVWYSMLYPYIGQNVTLEVDFEQPVLELDILAKGRVTLFVFLYAAWKLYFDKDIRKVIRLWNKEVA